MAKMACCTIGRDASTDDITPISAYARAQKGRASGSLADRAAVPRPCALPEGGGGMCGVDMCVTGECVYTGMCVDGDMCGGDMCGGEVREACVTGECARGGNQRYVQISNV